LRQAKADLTTKAQVKVPIGRLTERILIFFGSFVKKLISAKKECIKKYS
jgi:hypothetical protein